MAVAINISRHPPPHSTLRGREREGGGVKGADDMHAEQGEGGSNKEKENIMFVN
jgi:hypothetical protein